MFTVVPSKNKLNDNLWHTVLVGLNERGQFSVRVDNDNIDVSTSDGDRRLDLSGYVIFKHLVCHCLFTRVRESHQLSSLIIDFIRQKTYL